MQFHDHGLVVSGTDFFDLMARQMMGVHKSERGRADSVYDEALQNLLSNIGENKASLVNAVTDAVGMIEAEAEEKSYKNGFADAICMILQAAMHGK